LECILYGACVLGADQSTVNTDHEHIHVCCNAQFDCKQAVREAATICPRPLQVASGLATAGRPPTVSVRDLGPMYTTDRRQTSDTHRRLMPPSYGGGA